MASGRHRRRLRGALVPLLGGAALLAGCAHDPGAAAPDAAAAPPGSGAAATIAAPDAVRVDAAGFSLLRGDTVLRTVPAGGAVAAFATDGELLAWQVDDDTGTLHLRAATAADSPVATVALGFEADALCLDRIIDGAAGPNADHDLFAIDGDGRLHHFWLSTGATGPAAVATPAVRAVRTLPIQPDATACALDANRVYVLDPATGIAAWRRNAESDAVMELVYVPAPVGAGAIDPVAFRVDRAGGPATGGRAARSGRLLVWDAAGRAHALDIAEPGVLRPAVAAADRQPLQPHAADAAPTDPRPAVHASAETDPVPDGGDAADDPAILVGTAGRAWIAGTNKRLGLHVYALDGREVQRIERGRLNNVDALPLGAGRHLVAASNRTHHTLDLFSADVDAGTIAFAAAVPLDLDDPYGLCMGDLPGIGPAVVVGGKDGAVQVWAVDAATWAARLVRGFRLGSQTEGCAWDPVGGRLYVGEEDTGVWVLDPVRWTPEPFALAADGVLVPDVEGVDVYRRGDQAWLVVSSQGDDGYVLYPLDGAGIAPVRFTVGPDRAAGIDGASETDGLAATPQALPGYPHGILVVQDGRKRAPEGTQNFKVIDWRAIEAVLPARPAAATASPR